MSRTVLFISTAVALGVAALLVNPKAAKQTAEAEPNLATLPVQGPEVTPVTSSEQLTGFVPLSKDSPVQLSVKLSHPMVPFGGSELYAQVDLQARQLEAGPRKPVSLALVIDRSGSMNGEKLARAKQAAMTLIEQLREDDALAIVHYGGDVQSLPSMYATASHKQLMTQFVSRITDDGDTNISQGLEVAGSLLEVTRRDFDVRRIILLSDGQPTSGIVSTPGLVSIAEKLRSRGFTVSALGIGVDFNEALMSSLANTGGGFYGYIQNSEMLASVFTRELNQATSTVARNVRVRLEFPMGVEVQDVFGVTVSPGSRSVEVPLYDLAGGQSARVLARVRVNAPTATELLPIVTAHLSYEDLNTGARREPRATALARSTDDASKVTAALDKEVAANGIQALGSLTIAKAAVAYQEGRTQEAEGLFNNVRSLFGSSADALGGDTRFVAEANNVSNYQQQLRGSSGAALNAQVKQYQKKSLKDFGYNNTY